MLLEAAGQIGQRLFEFAAEDRLGALLAQKLRVHRRIQSVTADVRMRVQQPHLLHGFDSQPRGRVHGQIERDQGGVAQRLDAGSGVRETSTAVHFVARRTQPRRGRGQAEWLAAQFVRRDEQYSHVPFIIARVAKIEENTSPMLAATSIAEEILDLKKERRAILLAHHYQEDEIQELADVVGDSLELVPQGARISRAT